MEESSNDLDLRGLGMVPSNVGLKFDETKPSLGLLPTLAIEELGKVMEFGSKKYGPNNWRKGLSYRRLISATLRHIFQFMRGEDKDPESGFSHLAHAQANLCMLFEMPKDFDDRNN